MILTRSMTATSCRFVLVRPGATAFDEQGRMKGSMDIPLSASGEIQVERIAMELANLELSAIYSAPCASAVATADRLVEGRNLKVKVIDCFRNIDHGLWHGKLIDEVKRTQPKVYRQGQDDPDLVCPPGGESVHEAKQRVLKALHKVAKRASGVVALVIPDPMASVLQSVLEGEELRDLWAAETDEAHWDLIETAI